MLAQKLGVWIPLDEVADAWEGVTSIFRDYGYRRLRSRARLKFLVADWGVEKFREVLENEYLGRRWSPATRRPPPSATATTSACTSRRTATSTSASRRSPAGSPARCWSQLADLMEEYGVAGARLTPYQKIVLDRRPAGRRRGRSSPGWTRSACRRGRRAGGRTRWPAPASSSASSRSSRPRPGPATWSTSWSAGSPTSTPPITVNVNGCPNACARTQVADIGLKGQLVMDGGEQVEGFQVHLGGATGLQANFGRKLRAHKVTSAGLDDYVTAVVTAYLAERDRRRVVHRVGAARRRGRAARRAEHDASWSPCS